MSVIECNRQQSADFPHWAGWAKILSSIGTSAFSHRHHHFVALTVTLILHFCRLEWKFYVGSASFSFGLIKSYKALSRSRLIGFHVQASTVQDNPEEAPKAAKRRRGGKKNRERRLRSAQDHTPDEPTPVTTISDMAGNEPGSQPPPQGHQPVQSIEVPVQQSLHEHFLQHQNLDSSLGLYTHITDHTDAALHCL